MPPTHYMMALVRSPKVKHQTTLGRSFEWNGLSSVNWASISHWMPLKIILVHPLVFTLHGLASTVRCSHPLPYLASLCSFMVSVILWATHLLKSYATARMERTSCVHCVTSSAGIGTWRTLKHTWKLPIGLTTTCRSHLLWSCPFGQLCSLSFGNESKLPCPTCGIRQILKKSRNKFVPSMLQWWQRWERIQRQSVWNLTPQNPPFTKSMQVFWAL